MAQVWLVTGGAGFIGSHLVRASLERGRRVRVLDNFSTGFRKNIAEVLGDIELLEGDIRDTAVCAQACAGVEVVFHEAALPSVARSMETPEETFAADTVGTFNMLNAARQAGVRRFVFAASSSAYGAGPELPKRETQPVLPVSPYAAAKACGELLVSTFYRAFGLETANLRYFNIFGPRQDPHNQYAGVIAAFAARMLKGEPPVIFGDGTQSRDFTYVANAVHANLLAAEAPAVHGETVNVGCGAAINLNQMADTMNKILGTRLAPLYKPTRAGDVMHSLADISQTRQLLGYAPPVPFAAGLQQTIDWYRKELA